MLEYYDFLPGMAGVIADGAGGPEDQVGAMARDFEELGIDELIFDPTVPQLEQLDLLADAVLRR